MTKNEPLTNPLARNWVWRIFQLHLQVFCAIWLRFRTRGSEHLPPGGALILANHQSFLDPLLVAVYLKRPVSFLARDSLFRVPVIGWILKHTYVMSIRRESAGTESLRKSISRLDQGFLVGLFPEGTRTTDGQVGEVKPGFVALVRRASVPIIPVGIAGAFEAMPRKSRLIWPVKVCLVYGEPISAETIQQLSQKGREQEFVNFVQRQLVACQQEAEMWRAGTFGRESSAHVVSHKEIKNSEKHQVKIDKTPPHR